MYYIVTRSTDSAIVITVPAAQFNTGSEVRGVGDDGGGV